MTGIITRVILTKGFGFIVDEHGEERFLHASDMAEGEPWLKLHEGQRIEFEPYQKPDGKGNGLRCGKVRAL